MIIFAIDALDYTLVEEFNCINLKQKKVVKETDEEEPEEVFSKEDEAKVKERLRALGYLD